MSGPQGRELRPYALRAARGDRAAAAVVLKGIERLLWRVVNRLCKKWPELAKDSEDLFKDAEKVALEALPRYNGSTSPTTFLVTSAELALRRIRKKYMTAGGIHVPSDVWDNPAKRDDAFKAATARVTRIGPTDNGGASLDLHDGNGVREEAVDASVDVEEMLPRLNARERDVITRRFGLGGTTPMTLLEVGGLYGLSRERIRQIQEEALKKLAQART